MGNKIAGRHIKIAQGLMKQWWIELPDPDLAYLVEGTPEFTAYIRELRWAQHFALLNLEEIMDRTVRQLADWMCEPVVEQDRINCHHKLHHAGDALEQDRSGCRGRVRSRPGRESSG